MRSFVTKLALVTASMFVLGSILSPSTASAFKWSRMCNTQYNYCASKCAGAPAEEGGVCIYACENRLLNCEATGIWSARSPDTGRPPKSVPGIGQTPPRPQSDPGPGRPHRPDNVTPPKSNPTSPTKPQSPGNVTPPKSNSSQSGPGLR